jgi:hypothetical protein
MHVSGETALPAVKQVWFMVHGLADSTRQSMVWRICRYPTKTVLEYVVARSTEYSESKEVVENLSLESFLKLRYRNGRLFIQHMPMLNGVLVMSGGSTSNCRRKLR